MTLSVFMVIVAVMLVPFVWERVCGVLGRKRRKVRFEENQKNKQFDKLLKKKGKKK